MNFKQNQFKYIWLSNNIHSVPLQDTSLSDICQLTGNFLHAVPQNAFRKVYTGRDVGHLKIDSVGVRRAMLC